MDRLIDSKPLRTSEELRVALQEYHGRTALHVRRWYRDGDEWKPGKGASVPVEDLPWLRLAIERAEAAARGDGLIREESYELVGLPLPPELGGDVP